MSIQFLVNGDGVGFAVHLEFDFLAFYFVDVNFIVVAVYFKCVIFHCCVVYCLCGWADESPPVLLIYLLADVEVSVHVVELGVPWGPCAFHFLNGDDGVFNVVEILAVGKDGGCDGSRDFIVGA